MEVSIIIPTYNRPEFLKKALSSIAGQTFRDFEVVLVNDGGCSVENVISKSGIEDKVRYFCNSKNLGQTKSLNIGLYEAKGEFIAYLDDDDIFFSNHLDVLYSFLSSNNSDFAFTNCIRTVSNPETDIIIKREILPVEKFSREKLFHRNLIPVISTMHRRSCLEKSGMFDENLQYLKDWDLFVRLSEHYKFYHINKITCEVFFRTDKSNMTFLNWDTRRELAEDLRAKYLKKYKSIKSDNEITVETYSKQLEQALLMYSIFQEADKFLHNHFKEFKKKGIKKVAIFGASLSGQIYLDYLRKSEIEVSAFYDNDPSKHGKKLDGVTIQSPEKIDKNECDAIIIASRGFREEIYDSIKHLQEKGIPIIKE
ncbi:glycosyltransferase [bacterium]|nr:glycosyltransferase [bacterium]